MTGLMSQKRPSPFFLAGSPSADGRCSTSMAMTFCRAPTWGAASPTPFASYIVSARSSHSLRTEASTSATGFAFCLRRGAGEKRISRRGQFGRPPKKSPDYTRRGEVPPQRVPRRLPRCGRRPRQAERAQPCIGREEERLAPRQLVAGEPGVVVRRGGKNGRLGGAEGLQQDPPGLLTPACPSRDLREQLHATLRRAEVGQVERP